MLGRVHEETSVYRFFLNFKLSIILIALKRNVLQGESNVLFVEVESIITSGTYHPNLQRRAGLTKKQNIANWTKSKISSSSINYRINCSLTSLHAFCWTDVHYNFSKKNVQVTSSTCAQKLHVFRSYTLALVFIFVSYKEVAH